MIIQAEIPDSPKSDPTTVKAHIAGSFRLLSQEINGLSNRASAIRESIQSLEDSFSTDGGKITKSVLTNQIDYIDLIIADLQSALNNMGGSIKITTSKIDAQCIKYT